jgi:uncharacterized protein (TIGR02301 family)
VFFLQALLRSLAPALALAAWLALAALAPSAAALTAAAPAQAQDDLFSPIGDLERLAAMIGAAHQLRQLCDGGDFTWREQMLSLIRLEARNDDRRERRLIDAFNDGFRRQERQRLGCGADSRRAESQLADEGRRLAEALRDRYLN